MAKISVRVSADDYFESSGEFGIVGPRPGDDDGTGWVVYRPGKLPCICDDFESAVRAMREGMSKSRRARGG